MIIVRDEEAAQRALTEGTLACPHAGCAGRVYRDGYARSRRIRTRAGGRRELRPQRVACRRCERTHVLLPAWCVPGRCDDAETIGVALLAAVDGHGHRSIAARLGRPVTTARGWLRAARSHAHALREPALCPRLSRAPSGRACCGRRWRCAAGWTWHDEGAGANRCG